MSRASLARQRYAELVAAVAQAEQLPLHVRVTRVTALVAALMSFSGALLDDVEQLRAEVQARHG
jgi:hypothetical protein